MKKLMTIVAAGGLALSLTACGGAEDEAESAVTDFAQALEDKDYDKVCDSIDPELVKTIEDAGEDCTSTMEKSGEEVSGEMDSDDLEVVESKISEDEKTATVTVKNKDDKENDVKLKKVDDEWKITFE